jgi:hypothetical protein
MVLKKNRPAITLKLIALGILFLCFQLNIFCQSFQGGIFGGFVSSQVSGDQLAGFNKAGLHGGAFIYRDINERWADYLRMAYIQKGSRTNSQLDKNILRSYLLRLHCAEVPLTIVYKTKKRLALEAGLVFARIVATYEGDDTGEFKDQLPFKKNEVSIQASLDYKLSPNFIIQVLAQNSLTPIRTNGVKSGIYLGQYNSILGFNVHYFFSKKQTQQ